MPACQPVSRLTPVIRLEASQLFLMSRHFVPDDGHSALAYFSFFVFGDSYFVFSYPVGTIPYLSLCHRLFVSPVVFIRIIPERKTR